MSLKSVESLGKKGVSTVGNVIGANKRNIEFFMVAIIVVEYLPHDLMGVPLKRMLKPLMDPIKKFIKHPFVIIISKILWPKNKTLDNTLVQYTNTLVFSIHNTEVLGSSDYSSLSY